MLCPDKAEMIVKTCCVLHNFLRSLAVWQYSPSELMDHEDNDSHNLIPGVWRQDDQATTSWLSILPQGNRGHIMAAKDVRDTFRDYFCTVGQVDCWRVVKLINGKCKYTTI